ncbi:hypothetical protein G7Z17_g7160 [Cylindrodendrum hubeiense]|uniref:Enoyl reductase (ER) domain-containing protein n=1 Tax=Cylindrodendrum hubeiense TaxID=595255 RepID=A0A9P5H8V3_9HYPO|nr:hypothetical protein G7Z17_g7160 [Cylindrodendrum hubeiense]
MKALVLTPSTHEATVRELPRPIPGVGEVLIRVHAVALNPVDSLYVSHPIAAQDYRVIGTDFAGVVAGASPELAGLLDPRTKLGARVAGFLQGACSVNDRPGLPSPFVSSSGALPIESQGTEGPINVLIYGSSTSLGLYAAQLVHLSSLTSGRKIRLIGAASASKHDLLRKAPYLYDALVDYRDPNWPDKVREAAANRGVDYAIDCISEGATVEKVHSTFGQTIPASPAARDFAAKFFAFLGSDAEDGKVNLEPNPLRIMPGGLERVSPDGFTLLGADGVTSRSTTSGEGEHMRPISAEKMVYVIE